MKIKIFCWKCDTEFSVSYQGDEPLHHCPLCGADLEVNDEDVTQESD